MEPTSDLAEIKKIDHFVQEASLAISNVPSMSIFRVPASAYANWKILITPDNHLELGMLSQKAYMREWADTPDALNKLVSKASEEAGLGDVNALMNAKVGELAAAEIRKLTTTNNSVNVVDIGSGAGATTIAAIEALPGNARYLPHSRISFTLIEPSQKRNLVAEGKIAAAIEGFHSKMMSRAPREVYSGPSITVFSIAATDTTALRGFRDRHFSLAISNAAIHHHAFNAHLHEISRVLKNGSLFINGDWHNSMWESPKRVYFLLLALSDSGNKRLLEKIEEFMLDGKVGGLQECARPNFRLLEFANTFFGSSKSAYDAFDSLTKEEREANVGIVRFWVSVATLCKAENVISPIGFLEGHERRSSRIANFASAGFHMQPIPAKYSHVRGELAGLMVARKPLMKIVH